MKPILTPEQSAELDRAAQARGVSVAELMENAGREVARTATEIGGGMYGRRAVAVCGKGNNGGDGLVAARYLARWGMRVAVILLADPKSLRDPAAQNLERLAEVGVPMKAGMAALPRELGRADVVVDALFGTGFRGEPEGEDRQAIEAMNEAPAPVIAADIPSGVNGTTGAVEGEAVWAAATVTFGAAKPGLLLYPGAARVGFLEVADIGFPPDLVRSDVFLVEGSDVAQLLPVRPSDAHKRSTGVVLVVGGSRGMTGALRLMAGAAYRTGAGLVTVAAPESIVPVVQEALAEATFVTLPETPEGTVAESAMEHLRDRLDGFDSIAVGPGLTRNHETAAFVRTLVQVSAVPVVVDADGLNAFAGRAEELRECKGEVVLTPHAGEFVRLAGIGAPDLEADRIGRVRELASAVEGTVLLKGNPTLVASREGVLISATGGPALATGGTGDVLTGIVSALLARGLSPRDAAAAGAYMHGVAGALAGAELGDGTIAGEVLERIPAAVLAIEDEAEGEP